MTRLILISILFFGPLQNSFCQVERKIVRTGVSDYKDGKFSEAEVNFRKATDEKPGLFEAEYDIANSLFKQKKFEEAANEYDKLLQKSNEPNKRADLYHNLGNSQLMAQQFDKSIESYKNSLRIRPNDEDTRYNLAYALENLKQQQQQQNQEQNKDDKNKDKDKKDNKDQQDKDQQKDQNKDNKDQQKKEDEKNKEEQNPSEPKISKEEAEQMLNAVQNQEKDVKAKLDKKKAVARPVSAEKDW